MRGGAERVLRILADMYPEAPIYTLLYNEKRLGDWFPKERIRTPRIPFPQKLLPGNARYNHHLYLRKFPQMIESFDFSEFDLVVSTSSAFAHGSITNGNPKHLSYINAPARYLWDRTHDVLETASKGIFGPFKKRYLETTFHTLRIWDAETSARPDKLLAASKDVERRIELYWRRESDVVYPPIDSYWLTHPLQKTGSAYFVVASTLVAYKNIELAIDACNALALPLKIVGDGPHKRALQKRAGKTVEFLGYTSRDELRKIYAGASALLFPGIEDFGIAPLEAMSCGTPVIAYRAGGPLETIIDGKTGAFFNEQNSESLQKVLQNFDPNLYSKDTCRARAEQFSQDIFTQNIRNAIASM